MLCGLISCLHRHQNHLYHHKAIVSLSYLKRSQWLPSLKGLKSKIWSLVCETPRKPAMPLSRPHLPHSFTCGTNPGDLLGLLGSRLLSDLVAGAFPAAPLLSFALLANS